VNNEKIERKIDKDRIKFGNILKNLE